MPALITALKTLLQNRLIKPLLAFLQLGLTPEKLALCVAVGVAVGIFPVLGSTTLLCAGIGLIMRLNQPALQTVNFSMYPLQILLLIPFFRLGEKLFQVSPLPITIDEVGVLIQAGVGHAIHVLWDTTMRAIVAWILVAPVVGVVVYFSLLPIFRRAAPVKPI